MTIGAMARASGLTTSALRFYDDSGVLPPAWVDPATGYRYYAGDQVERAVAIRRLREIDMPLAAVTAVLDGDPDSAQHALDEHVRTMRERADVAAAVAREFGAGAPGTPVHAAELREAIGQVISAAASGHEIPILHGVLFECRDGELSLTATDRYRLATRTLAVPRGHSEWSAVAELDSLRAVTAWLTGDRIVRIGSAEAVIRFADSAGEATCDTVSEATCDTVAGTYPDYRAMLAALPTARTHVVVERAALRRALDTEGPLPLAASDGTLTAGPTTLAAVVRGEPIALHANPETLSAAVESAVGPEVMLDLTAPDQPMTVRSATDGDLMTLVMPVRPDRAAGPT
ncbi:MerR family transcriptional regulator [Rhodococcus sp. HNM0569]|nr:MerR family transcriptional regulator [Rhodococcus sp. HNM0569]NLU82542.1 MerR family transcriptional regulator [Rhodococcus sp. HNM0569]